eukprot:GHVL01032191.1.p1 GENE.GHVL01032191.1~~GHVL01032191.1.p1  ORF type:complete len:533 (+),score=142.18 GHVL01032191.1:351-1949(+)
MRITENAINLLAQNSSTHSLRQHLLPLSGLLDEFLISQTDNIINLKSSRGHLPSWLRIGSYNFLETVQCSKIFVNILNILKKDIIEEWKTKFAGIAITWQGRLLVSDDKWDELNTVNQIILTSLSSRVSHVGFNYSTPRVSKELLIWLASDTGYIKHTAVTIRIYPPLSAKKDIRVKFDKVSQPMGGEDDDVQVSPRIDSKNTSDITPTGPVSSFRHERHETVTPSGTATPPPLPPPLVHFQDPSRVYEIPIKWHGCSHPFISDEDHQITPPVLLVDEPAGYDLPVTAGDEDPRDRFSVTVILLLNETVNTIDDDGYYCKKLQNIILTIPTNEWTNAIKETCMENEIYKKISPIELQFISSKNPVTSKNNSVTSKNNSVTSKNNSVTSNNLLNKPVWPPLPSWLSFLVSVDRRSNRMLVLPCSLKICISELIDSKNNYLKNSRSSRDALIAYRRAIYWFIRIYNIEKQIILLDNYAVISTNIQDMFFMGLAKLDTNNGSYKDMRDSGYKDMRDGSYILSIFNRFINQLPNSV